MKHFPTFCQDAHYVARWLIDGSAVLVLECNTPERAQAEADRMNRLDAAAVRGPVRAHQTRRRAVRYFENDQGE